MQYTQSEYTKTATRREASEKSDSEKDRKRCFMFSSCDKLTSVIRKLGISHKMSQRKCRECVYIINVILLTGHIKTKQIKY